MSEPKRPDNQIADLLNLLNAAEVSGIVTIAIALFTVSF